MLFFCPKIKKKKMEITTLDQHVEVNHDVATAPGAKLVTIIAIARPILSGVAAFLFFKPKWANIINALVSALDTWTNEQTALPIAA